MKSIVDFSNEEQMIRPKLLWVLYLKALKPRVRAARSVQSAVRFHLDSELRSSMLKLAS